MRDWSFYTVTNASPCHRTDWTVSISSADKCKNLAHWMSVITAHMYIVYLYNHFRVCVHMIVFICSFVFQHYWRQEHMNVFLLRSHGLDVQTEIYQQTFYCISRFVSKPRDLYWEFYDRPKICCRGACQISKRCDISNYQSRGFRDFEDIETGAQFSWSISSLFQNSCKFHVT